MQENQTIENLARIEADLKGFSARLLPVSKTFPPEKIMEAYLAGYRDFGENRVQELLEKKEQLPDDIRWHLIGHLQTNKVKFIAPFVHLIHSVDSEKLLVEIQKQAERLGRRIQVLLQVQIADEETKSGWDANALRHWLALGSPANFPEVDFIGLMGMATNTADMEKVRNEFRMLASLKKEFEALKHLPNVRMQELSMGMSGDFRIALEEGSTMVRMGSAVFGSR
jgi:pyridoxal phosphate enzyme (YggS family)